MLWAEDGSEARPKTEFRIECTSTGVWFRCEAENAFRTKSELELFFRTSEDLPDGDYYQFYTDFSNPGGAFTDAERVMLARRGVPGDFHPSLRIHYSYFTERLPGFSFLKDFRTRLVKTDTGGTAEVFVPWNALARILPFDETGKGRWWRFSVFRSTDGVSAAWQGKRHAPPTWGMLVFPDIPEDQLADIYRTIAVQNTAKTEPVIDPTLFAPASIAPALVAQEKERVSLQKRIPPTGAKLSLPEMKSFAAATDRMRTYRDVLTAVHLGTRMEWKGWKLESVATTEDGTETAAPLAFAAKQGYAVRSEDGKPVRGTCGEGSIPPTDVTKKVSHALRLTYVFPEDVADQARLTDLCASVRGRDPRKLRCSITLNSKVLAKEHDPAAMPAHFDLPAPRKGDTLVVTLRETDGRDVNFLFFCRVETDRFGLVPRAPVNHDRLRPTDRILPVKRDNEYDMHFVNVYAGELARLLSEKPRVIQFGGWFEIGFQLNCEDRRKELYDKYRLTHVGNISDNNLITNLKLENYPLEYLNPSMIILNAHGTFSDDPEQVCAAMRESLRIIRGRVPRAKIVILGIVPGTRTAERAKILNPAIARLAEAENIPYRDVFPIFMDAGGKVRADLFQPGGYMSPEGYRQWTELLVPDLQESLEAR